MTRKVLISAHWVYDEYHYRFRRTQSQDMANRSWERPFRFFDHWPRAIFDRVVAATLLQTAVVLLLVLMAVAVVSLG